MKKSVHFIFIIIITAIIVGSGVYMFQQNTNKKDAPIVAITKKKAVSTKEPLLYKINNLVSVTKTTEKFDYTAKNLEDMAEECSTKYEAGYFDKLVAKFKDTNKTIYSFKYLGNGQGSGIYRATVLPNKAGYTSVEKFGKDFDVCAVGGTYPSDLNSKWLLFGDSCGSGYADGSGRPNGCDEVYKIIKSSLKLNQSQLTK